MDIQSVLTTHEMVTERPVEHIAHRVVDFRKGGDVLAEAERIATLPAVADVLVKVLKDRTVIVVTCPIGNDKTDTIHIGMGGWLVLRMAAAAPQHPLDWHTCQMMDLSGRIMFYSDEQFDERYIR